MSAQMNTKGVVRKGQEKYYNIYIKEYYNSLEGINKEQKGPVILQSSEVIR